MVGGIIYAISKTLDITYLLVRGIDCENNDWKIVQIKADIDLHFNDYIWWQSQTAYISNDIIGKDYPITYYGSWRVDNKAVMKMMHEEFKKL